ncbi:MAG: hypothetical protein H6563_14685 [Lewinellaceae bacterium]|nr:hypothetical protein [Lewinellaceae bacterium]
MELDWLQETEVLIKLLNSGASVQPDRFSHRFFLGLVRFMCPEYLEGKDLRAMAREFAEDEEAFASFLLDIPEFDRARIFAQFARDVAPLFPVPAQHLLDELEHFDEEAPTVVIKESNTEKLNRYLKRIDGAILVGRYTLAFNLTNRLLKEYYRDFLQARAPLDSAVEDLHLMSLSVCRHTVQYFRKHYIPYSERRIILIATVTNVLATTMGRLKRSSSGSFSIDKAIALYARNNVRRIVRFLSRMM